MAFSLLRKKLQRRRISGLTVAERTIIYASRDYFYHRKQETVVQILTPLLGAETASTAGSQLTAALNHYFSGYRFTPTIAKQDDHRLSAAESFILQALRAWHNNMPAQR